VINYKHLYYFWVVARQGGITRASERLHLTPQTISGQISLLEDSIGEALFTKAGRNLELTGTGRLVLGFADEIFSLGGELEDALRNLPRDRQMIFKVGIADVVPKTIAYRLLAPALSLPGINVRGFNHVLGECGISFLAVPQLASALRGKFPQSLNGAPLLIPSENNLVQAKLLGWLDGLRIHPRIVGEFDDSALMKEFGQAGAGIFAIPTPIATEVARQLGVRIIGSTQEVREQYYAISVERRISHPAVSAITETAREWLS
jgi:LysR family transcriptional activator of nhaA